jgi:asparagine synthase (glutamine-hydrolysing)
MCGIAGMVWSDPGEESRSIVDKMLATMVRRGPDSQGMASWPNCTLGHRRLAVVDLSPAAGQPMVSEDGRTAVVFNGCIYNFRELRKQLEQCGHRFRSHSDTEVLVHGYEEWGVDELVKRLRGMFAYAIWDAAQRRLTLVRDRLGVKPLAYAVENGRLAFASTVGALRASGYGSDIEPEAVLEFLEFGFITDQKCVYSGIQKLPPATILEWQDGKITQRTYWELTVPAESEKIGFAEAVEETERLIVEAVRLRLQADVPVGALLSGGIDSALVCWAMAQLNAKVKAYTVAAKDDPTDESTQAAATARTLGVDHEVVNLPEMRLPLLEELADAYGEPFASSSALALLTVSRQMKRSVTVLLTGDGGDDIFLGYPFFRNAFLAQGVARILPECAPKIWKRADKFLSSWEALRRCRNFLNYATRGLSAHAAAHEGLPYFAKHLPLGERLTRHDLPQRKIPESFLSARHLLDEVFAYHLRTHFVGEFLPKIDGATMYHSLEARAPLLDQYIWEFGVAIPASVRMQGGRPKAVLRAIVKRRVSPETAARKKQGFTVPIERWLASRWKNALEVLQGETLLEQEGWIRRGRLAVAVDNGLKRRWVPVQVWRLLVFEHWLRKQKDT